MEDSDFIRLLNLCFIIERRAVGLYRRLSNGFPDGELHDFWSDMAKQEMRHTEYWKSLLELAKHGRIRNVFDDTKRIETELLGVCGGLDELERAWPAVLDIRTAFLTAYKAEFYVLHPAFAALFHLLRSETRESSPEDDYAQHIGGLVIALKHFGKTDPELELIADLTTRLWNRNQELALQLADLKSLRNLVPICMHCKNIRNDQGYWDKVEHYVELHSSMQFSHGICPDCIRKHYPELADPKE
ncbi:MAG TPA: hypothetical protein VGB38_03695 [bacterium]